MSRPAPKGSICPTCNGDGYLFVEVEGVRRQLSCGHSVCQGLLEDRLTSRIMREITRHLPADWTRDEKR